MVVDRFGLRIGGDEMKVMDISMIRLRLGGINNVSRHHALTMKHEKCIKRVGYVTLAALIALVAFSYWVAHRIKDGQTPAFLSEGAASVIASICALVFYVAVALAGFIVIRAFYLGLTQSDSRQKHEHAMTSDYTVEINTKAKALIYREGDKTFRFEMDTRARPMVVYFHEFSVGSPPGLKTPLTDEVRDTICPRINQYFMKNRVAIKATYTGLRTPRA